MSFKLLLSILLLSSQFLLLSCGTEETKPSNNTPDSSQSEQQKRLATSNLLIEKNLKVICLVAGKEVYWSSSLIPERLNESLSKLAFLANNNFHELEANQAAHIYLNCLIPEIERRNSK